MKITQDVLTVLSRVEADATTARIVDPLERSLYAKVNKVLEALGGKWNRARKAHVFDAPARDRIDEAIVLGEVTTREDIGFFPTPAKLAAFLVELADVQGGDRVLEPSAGTGRIVDALLGADASVWACERDGKMRDGLRDRPAMRNRRHAVHVFPHEDFLDLEALDPSQPAGFDRVVMNPPFCRVGKGDHLDHVFHAHAMLREGGVLVSVLPASITFREDRRHAEFRDWIRENHGRIVDLPDGSFKESGTMARTCVVRMAST